MICEQAPDVPGTRTWYLMSTATAVVVGVHSPALNHLRHTDIRDNTPVGEWHSDGIAAACCLAASGMASDSSAVCGLHRRRTLHCADPLIVDLSIGYRLCIIKVGTRQCCVSSMH
eukprot:TRINITY_DN7055_c0_g1_i1.p2 TRINITY_DN7055_c0_g1~~TRINITY_DN7055_c0_g1_i1.p2  ORF type:complete len:115 (-),score=1.44 TRINITY_DN7055_c0_g1_i1:1373-1717(-)